jgi:CHAT domain-containing protein/tetratricopeptide (TPR) repeat protein
MAARAVYDLANLYYIRGDYERAESFYQRALKMQEELLGTRHSDVALSLHGLARLHRTQGRYEQAEQLSQRALDILEVDPTEHALSIAMVLNGMALLYTDQGAYTRAEPLLRRALEIWEKALGADHPAVATALNNLAEIYRAQGTYEHAEQFYERAFQVVEAVLGKNRLMADLREALLHHEQGTYSRAEPLYYRALQIWEGALGKNHPNVALVLGNLALLQSEQRAYAPAEPLYRRALQIMEATLGKNHPTVATTLYNLARLYVAQGMYAQAEPLLQRALRIAEGSVGKDHFIMADLLHTFGVISYAQGDLVAALPFLERSLAISEQRLRKEAIYFSEARMASFLGLLRGKEVELYNLLRERPSEVAVRRLALTASLLYKGRSVNTLTDISQSIYRSLGVLDREAFEYLRSLRTQLAVLSLGGTSHLSLTEHEARVRDLEAQCDRLEGYLAHRSARFRTQRHLPNSADVLARVTASLPPDSALIELVTFTSYSHAFTLGPSEGRTPGIPVYVALVLLPEGEIRMVDLGPAAAIDSAVADLRAALTDQTRPYEPVAQKLYQLVMAPIVPLLGSQRRLFISPDGDLNLVPFAVLHDGQHNLLDTYGITYLTSGRDLLSRPQELPPMSNAVVFARPDFNTGGAPSALLASNTDSFSTRSGRLARFYREAAPFLSHASLDPLPGTEQEAKILHQLFPNTRMLLGARATTAALFEVQAPRILHIGTHGFLLESDKVNAPSPPALTTRDWGRGIAESAGRLAAPDEPMLRSGLYAAGNTPVTALELSSLNLWGTQLVVLSACDTGLGQTEVGQGVAGLRRAFIVAGAETVVASLWKIEDAIAPELMQHYYRDLVAGRGRAEALHAAMRAIRAEHPHPYYWAAFIVVGKDGPLRPMPRTASPVTTTSH